MSAHLWIPGQGEKIPHWYVVWYKEHGASKVKTISGIEGASEQYVYDRLMGLLKGGHVSLNEKLLRGRFYVVDVKRSIGPEDVISQSVPDTKLLKNVIGGS